MRVKSWDLPIKAEWHRATILKNLSFGREGLILHLVEENTEKIWKLHFSELQAFKTITEESASYLIGLLPVKGAFYEVIDSDWIRELGLEKLEHLSSARHYIICCYDEVLEIMGTNFKVSQVS